MQANQPTTETAAPSTESPAGDRSRTISKDDAFHLLQNARRRAVLRYLVELDPDGPVLMRDVAEAVAAWEHDTTVPRLTSSERSRVYIALYQSHLDKLADHGVIEYEKSRGFVEPRPLIEVLELYLEDGLDADNEVLSMTPTRTLPDSGVSAAVLALIGK